MALPDRQWVDRVRKATSPELTVFSGATVGRSLYSNVVPAAITSFNTLMSNIGQSLRLKASSDQPSPESYNFQGADIWVEVGLSFKFETAGQDGTIDFKSDPFVQGIAEKRLWDFGNGPQVRKACILMKSSITADVKPKRAPGTQVLKVLLIHELIHAIGLGEHTMGGGDLFQADPDISSPVSNDPKKDVLKVNGGKTVPQAQAPELFLLASVVKRIEASWKP